MVEMKSVNMTGVEGGKELPNQGKTSLEQKVDALKSRINELRSEKKDLEMKLKEAGVRPFPNYKHGGIRGSTKPSPIGPLETKIFMLEGDIRRLRSLYESLRKR
jgi:hypothetical protein